MDNNNNKNCMAAFLIMLLFLMTGCGKSEAAVEQEQTGFEICDHTKIPDEIALLVEEKSSEQFNLSFINNKYLYIVIGYGRQENNSRCVVLKDIEETSEMIIVKVSLWTKERANQMGETHIGEVDSLCPMLILRREAVDKPVTVTFE